MVFSKLWRASPSYTRLVGLMKRKPQSVARVLQRASSWLNHYVPPSQYDTAIPKRLNLIYALIHYWEIIPLFFVTVFSLSIMTISIANCPRQKMDVVYSTHNLENNSRTMDLRCPYSVKWIVINQRTEPWPEMQDVLDRMKEAERKLAYGGGMCQVVNK